MIRIVAASALLLLVLAGCQPASVVRVPAPAMLSARGDDEPVSVHSKHVVIYEFWATWCIPCRTNIPNIQTLHERFENDDRVHLIAVHYDDRYGESENARAYLDACGASYPTLTNGWRIAHGYGVGGLPCTLVIGTGGREIYRHFGKTNPDQVIDLVVAHLDAHVGDE